MLSNECIIKMQNKIDEETKLLTNLEKDLKKNKVRTDKMREESSKQMDSSIIQPRFMKSDVQFLYESTNDLVRGYIRRIAAPSSSTKGSPVGLTAHDYGIELRGSLNNTRLNNEMSFRDATVDGTFRGTKDQWNEEIGKESRRIEAVQRNQVNELLSTEREKLELQDLSEEAIENSLKKTENELYSKINYEVNTGNKNLDTAIEHYQEYYRKMNQEGKNNNLEAFKDLSESKFYTPAIYNFDTIRTMDKKILNEMIKDSFISDVRNRKLLNNPKQLELEIKNIVNDLISTSESKQYSNYAYLNPKAPSIQSRKLQLDHSKLAKILVNDSEQISGLYHYKTSGRFKINKAFGEFGDITSQGGLDNLKNGVMKEIEVDLRKQFDNGKITDKKIKETKEAIERVFDDTLGTLRMDQNADKGFNEFSRMMTSLNSVTYGGMFGLNTLTETGAALWATSFKHFTSGHLGEIIKDVNTILYKKNGKPDSEFVNMIMNMGYMQDILDVRGMNKYADTEGIVDVGKVENKWSSMKGASESLTDLGNTLFKYNGMRALQSMLEGVVAGNSIEMIRRLGKKTELSKKEISTLNRWGMTPEDAKFLNKKINEHGEFNGEFVKDLNLDKWGSKESGMVQLMISRAIQSGVIQGDTMHLPSWVVIPDPLRKLVFQFLRFPIAAHEILLKRGIEEDKAGLMATAIASMGIYASIQVMREQAQIASGYKEKRDAKFDIFEGDPDAYLRLSTKSMNYASSLGFLTSILNYGLTMSGHSELGREYSNSAYDTLGATAGRLDDVQKIMKAITTGDIKDRQAWYALKGFIPFQNFPVFGESLGYITKEYSR